jgi:predicted metal-binding protein
MMSEQPRIAYGVQVIHDCIVRDTDICRTFDTKSKKLSLYREKQQLLDRHPEMRKMIDAGFVSSLDPKRGKFVGKVGWLPTELVITDQRIREMCRNMFTYPKFVREKAGVSFGPCPGSGKMSACPPFSPTPKETRAKLDQADIFIAIQSIYFVEPPGLPGWQDILVTKFKKELERRKGKGTVTAAFGAGPCQLCHPKPCLGGGECRAPEKRLFALESCGIAVSQLCSDIALLSGEPDWRIKFIKYYGTPRQTHKEWKISFGVAVKLE